MGWRLLKSYVRGPLTQEKRGYWRLFEMYPDQLCHFKLIRREVLDSVFNIEANSLDS